MAAPPSAVAAPSTPSIAMQNAPQQKQQQQSNNRFKGEHQLPPPTFLAAKISPLRSKSSRAKNGYVKTMGKTPPPPSSAIAAASNNADVSFCFLSKIIIFFLHFFLTPVYYISNNYYQHRKTICFPLECSWLPVLLEVLNPEFSQVQRPPV